MSTGSAERGRRSDAQRNRAQILTSTRELLADRGGTTVSMAEVARRAHVGMATLYRNFPGRRELLEALYEHEVDELCRAAEHRAGSPGDTLLAWLRRFVLFHANKHPIAAELLRHTDTDDPVFGGSRDRVIATGRPLLLAAQRAREIRDDLSLEQVLDLVLATSTIPGDHAYIDGIFQAVLDGLKPGTANAGT